MYCVFVLLPPAAMIAGSAFLIAPYQITSKINEALESGKVFELPDWINDCSRGDQLFAEMNQIRTDGIEKTMREMKSLENCLIVLMIFVSIGILLLILWFIAFLLFNSGGLWTDDEPAVAT